MAENYIAKDSIPNLSSSLSYYTALTLSLNFSPSGGSAMSFSPATPSSSWIKGFYKLSESFTYVFSRFGSEVYGVLSTCIKLHL